MKTNVIEGLWFFVYSKWFHVIYIHIYSYIYIYKVNIYIHVC
jgi:hypothetical protein